MFEDVNKSQRDIRNEIMGHRARLRVTNPPAPVIKIDITQWFVQQSIGAVKVIAICDHECHKRRLSRCGSTGWLCLGDWEGACQHNHTYIAVLLAKI